MQRGSQPREREPVTAAAVAERIRRAVVVVEADGTDTTRRPECVGALVDLGTAAFRAHMPPRVTAALTSARRQLERGDVDGCLAALREAQDLAPSAAGGARVH